MEPRTPSWPRFLRSVRPAAALASSSSAARGATAATASSSRGGSSAAAQYRRCSSRSPPVEIGGDARLKLEALRRTGIRLLRLEGDRAIAALLARAHVVVDALLGIGTRGIPEGRSRRVIELINASGRPVVALDIPSGMSADGGAPAGAAIRATMTLTFAGLKRGLLTAAGRSAGRTGERGPDRCPGRRGRAPRHRVSPPAGRRRRATSRAGPAKRTKGRTAICSSWRARSARPVRPR